MRCETRPLRGGSRVRCETLGGLGWADPALCPQIMIRSIFLFLDRTYVLQNSTLPSIW